MIISSNHIIGNAIDGIVTELFGHRGQYIDHPIDPTGQTPIRANGLVFTVDLDLAFHGYLEDGNVKVYPERRSSRCVHFLYYGGTAVWMAVTGKERDDNRHRFTEVKADEWTFITAHDSCWRGAASDEMFKQWIEMRRYVVGHVHEDHTQTAIHRVNDSSRLGGVWAKPFYAVDVILVRRPKEEGQTFYHPYQPFSINEVAVKPEWAVRVRN